MIKRCLIFVIGRLMLTSTLIAVPPVLTVDISFSGNSIGDTVYVSLESDQNLYTGWGEKKHFYTALNWDYWSLYSRLVIGSADTLRVTQRLYQYASPNWNYWYGRLDNNGNVIDSISEWNGPNAHPITQDVDRFPLYIKRTILGEDGVVDPGGNIHMVMTEGDGEIYYTKQDSSGTVLIDHLKISDNAQGWVGCSRIAIGEASKLYVIWSKDLHEICYITSDDLGYSWSTTNSLGYLPNPVAKPEVVTDKDGNVHIIWMDTRDSGGSSYELCYAKLAPNGMKMIDDSRLTYSIDIWSPKMEIDWDNNIHIVWSPGLDVPPELYYTKINGNLDMGGASVHNDSITMIEDTLVPVSAQYVSYPKVAIDSWDNPHIIYQEGEYGCGTTKHLYYIKHVTSPVCKVVFPDSHEEKLQMTGSGQYWEGDFVATQTGWYTVSLCGANANGEIGKCDTTFEFPQGVEESARKGLEAVLRIYPNPFVNSTVIGFQIPEFRSQRSEIRLQVYDMMGRLVEETKVGAIGKGLPAGIYFVKVKGYKPVKIVKMKGGLDE